MSELIEELLDYGFITGSTAFGTAKDTSDIDIVYSVDDTHHIAEIIKSYATTPSNYFAGYYIKDDDGKVINLIPVHPHDFLPWYLATKAITATLVASGIVDPIKKYAVFSGIVALFKGTVEARGTVAEYDKVKREIIGRPAPKIVYEMPDFLK